MLFISRQKLFSFSRYLNFCIDFSVIWKKGLIRNRLIPKFMTSQPGKQTIAIYILINISRSDSNQIIHIGQLIEYNMKKFFLEKSYTKCGGETSPRPSSKNQNGACLWINSLKLSLFILQPS